MAATMSTLPGYKCKNRMLEWFSSSVIFGLGVWASIWPESFHQGRFAAISGLLPIHEFIFGLLLLGGTHFACLHYNGNWPKTGPVIRMCVCLLSGAVYFQLALALWLNHTFTDTQPSPGIVSYLMLTCAATYSAMRAASDAQLRT